MNDLNFTFEESLWEQTLAQMNRGDSLSAVRFLTIMEQEEEDAVMDALMDLDTMAASVNDTTVLVVNANEYPFNVLTKYSSTMTVEGDATVVEDLSYILTQLPEKERKALVDALYKLIDQAAKKNGVKMD